MFSTLVSLQPFGVLGGAILETGTYPLLLSNLG